MRNIYDCSDSIDQPHAADPNSETPVGRVKNHVLAVRRSLYVVRGTLEELEAELNSALDELDNLTYEEIE